MSDEARREDAPDTSWMTPQEKWVWEEVREYGMADLRELPQTIRDQAGEGDRSPVLLPTVRSEEGIVTPRPSEAWPAWQILTANFIRLLVTSDAFVSRRVRNQALISGARITGVLLLSQETCPGSIALTECRIDDEVLLYDTRITASLALSGSHFVHGIVADRLNVGAMLNIRQDALMEDTLRLQGASIGGDIYLGGSRFQGQGEKPCIVADGINVGGAILIDRGGSFDGAVRLNSADIAGQFLCFGARFASTDTSYALFCDNTRFGASVRIASECFFNGSVSLAYASVAGSFHIKASRFKSSDGRIALYATELSVGGPMLLNNVEADGDVRLIGARVRGGFFANRSSFMAGASGTSIDAFRLSTEGLFCLRKKSRCDGTVLLAGASIGGDVQFCESEFLGKIDLSASRIEGELWLEVLEMDRPGPSWGPKAELNLQNAVIGTLHGSAPAWSREDGSLIGLKLDGLKIERLAGGQGGASLDTESNATLIAWIEAGTQSAGDRQRGFAQSPYVTIANALDTAGREDKARAIRIALERRKTREMLPGPRKAFRWLMSLVNAYGYKPYRGFVWAAFFMVVFAMIGVVWAEGGVAAAVAAGWQKHYSWLGFSLEQIVPFIDLDPISDNFLQEQFGTPTNEYGYAPSDRVPMGLRALFMAERAIGVIILGLSLAGITAWAERRS